MFQANLLKGKKILITGGGTGLGKAIGRRYCKLGAELVICGRRLEVLEETAQEFRQATGAAVSVFSCDIRDADAVEDMLSAIWNESPLDILVNNAAGNFIARTETLSPRAVDAVLNIVLHGSAYCTIGCGRRWIEDKRPGVVMSILTTSATHGRAFTVPSAMAKAGVLAMLKSLAVEWGPKGIRTVGIAPGPFPTEGAWSRLHPNQPRDGSDMADTIPLGRVGRHEELADLCAYVVSDQAGYINGEMITIDGGRELKGMHVDDLLAWTPEQWEAARKGS